MSSFLFRTRCLRHHLSSTISQLRHSQCHPTPPTALRVAARYYHLEKRPKPLSLPEGHTSLLPLVYSCSNLNLPPRDPYHGSRDGEQHISSKRADGSTADIETVIPFYLAGEPLSGLGHQPVGFLRPTVAQALLKDHEVYMEKGQPSPWHCSHNAARWSFSDAINREGRTARTREMESLVRRWKTEGAFEDILRGEHFNTSYGATVV